MLSPAPEQGHQVVCPRKCPTPWPRVTNQPLYGTRPGPLTSLPLPPAASRPWASPHQWAWRETVTPVPSGGPEIKALTRPLDPCRRLPGPHRGTACRARGVAAAAVAVAPAPRGLASTPNVLSPGLCGSLTTPEVAKGRVDLSPA